MGIAVVKKRRAPSWLLAWSTSPEWRAISRAQARKNLAAWKAAPRCGAHARSTGESCRNPVKAGFKRCRLHGATPKGKAWHVSAAAATPEKTERKVRDRIRAAEKRARRLAKMSPEELVAHRQWQRTHKPGSAAAREQARAERKQNAEMRKMLSAPRPAPTGEAAEIESQIAVLRAELDARRQDEQKPIGAFA